MGFISEFKRGLSGDDSLGRRSYAIAGTKVRCSHCGGEKFEVASAMLNTPGMTFLDLDWANRSATILVCANCTHIDWFLQEPEEI